MKSWEILIVLLSYFLTTFCWKGNADLYPFLVTIFHKENILCGGIVISKSHVMTAASCFPPYIQDLYVHYGDPKEVLRGPILVHKVLYAPNYEDEFHQNDLALLRLVSYLPLRDDEMGVKRILLAEEVDFVECFNIYMTKNLEQIPMSPYWSSEGVHLPDPKYNDFSLENDQYLSNITTNVLKGSPIICGGKAVGLYSSPWTNPNSGRELKLFTQIPLHLYWIELNVGNATSGNVVETSETNPPIGVRVRWHQAECSCRSNDC